MKLLSLSLLCFEYTWSTANWKIKLFSVSSVRGYGELYVTWNNKNCHPLFYLIDWETFIYVYLRNLQHGWVKQVLFQTSVKYKLRLQTLQSVFVPAYPLPCFFDVFRKSFDFYISERSTCSSFSFRTPNHYPDGLFTLRLNKYPSQLHIRADTLASYMSYLLHHVLSSILVSSTFQLK